MHFEFFCPVRLIVGDNALEKLPYMLESMGVSKPLLVTDRGIKDAGLATKVERLLTSYEVFYDVPPDSSLDVVMRLYSSYNSSSCNGLVALGGGSVIDTAKGLSLVISAGGGDISKLQGVDVVKKRTVPFAVVPTTCGTGSEVSRVAVIEDRKSSRKLAFASDAVFPDVVFLDPVAVETLPLRLVASTSMDALTHAIEAYTCIQKNPVSDAFALSAIKEIFKNAPIAKDDKKARFRLLVASTLAGVAFSNSMVGMVHSISHAIGGVEGVPHGVANAIMLPHVMRFNAGKSKEVAGLYREIFSYLALFVGDVAGKTLVDAVDSLMGRLEKEAGLPRRLRDVGVKRGDFDRIAKQAVLDGSAVFNPVSFEEDDVKALLEEAF